MAFEKKVPQWNAQGAEPPESLKNSGFQPEYKPPADYFNWFWHSVSEALKELQGMSPSDIGALPTSGGGTVAADNIRPIVVKNTADNACYTRFDGKDGILGFVGFAKEGYLRALTKDGAVLGDIYHTGNMPTPADIGALALSGGVMTGQGFYLNNKTGRIVGNQNGMWFRTASSDVDNNNDSRHLKLWNATYQTELARALYLFDTQTGKDYTIFGEHCKRGGSYTGNGSATSRTIDIGGIGYCLLVWSSQGFAFVTPRGLLYCASNVTGPAKDNTGLCNFIDGKLTMATIHNIVNESGITYNYQVL